MGINTLTENSNVETRPEVIEPRYIFQPEIFGHTAVQNSIERDIEYVDDDELEDELAEQAEEWIEEEEEQEEKDEEKKPQPVNNSTPKVPKNVILGYN